MLTRADDYDAIDHSNDYHDGHDYDGYGNLQEKHDAQYFREEKMNDIVHQDY